MRSDVERLHDILGVADGLTRRVERGRAALDVNHDIVWDTAEREIPLLADQVRAVLAAIGSDPLE